MVLVYTGIVSVLKVFLVNKQFFVQYCTKTVHSKFHSAISIVFPFLLRVSSNSVKELCLKYFPLIPGYLIHFNYKNTHLNPDFPRSLYQMMNSFEVNDAVVGYLSSMQLWSAVAILAKVMISQKD